MLTKTHIITALRVWINQRPGLEFGNYGDVSAYRSELRGITKDRKEALTLLRSVELRDSITAEQIVAAFPRAFSGRLSIAEVYAVNGKGAYKTIEEAKAVCEHIHQKTGAIVAIESKVALDYCTGQYWPTEYRRAAAAVLASVLWDYTRENYLRGDEETAGKQARPGDVIRAHLKREFGRGMQSRWFS